ncbi:MAG TPA: HAD-IA family hydrolase [Acidimicrobiales bacterium]|nr:HAD-IA family hydrolase [Acidimicrobiales bacterium]
MFDLDGTLLDSDVALAAPFVALGVPADEVTFGHVVAEECTRLGLSLTDYIERYDVTAAQPFAGVAELVSSLGRWAVCSNKVRASGSAELDRLGWTPDVALFAEDFGGGPKRLGPVLERLMIGDRGDVVFVGDTAHDRVCAADAGVTFALAAWNPRAAGLATARDLVFDQPGDLLAYLAR